MKTGSLQDQIREELKLHIISQGLKSGDPLPTEKVLAEELGTSRTVVREALKSLESLGIVEVRPGIGRFIREFNFEAILDNLPYSLETDIRSFKDILEIRVSLEVFFLSRDIDLFTPADIRDLEDLADGLQRLVDTGSAEAELIRLHTDFHCTLFRNSGNRLLIKLIRIFATIQRNLTLLNRYHSENRPLFVRQHRNIIRSIRSGDPEGAREVMIDHFREPMSLVERNLELVQSSGEKNLQEEKR